MSYILDALRKADAQRQGDPARGIHAQPARRGSDEYADRKTRGPGFWAACAASVAALGLVAWYVYPDKGKPVPSRAPEVIAQPPAVAITPVAPVPIAPAPPVAAMEPGPAAVPAATAVLPPPPRAISPPARDEAPTFATKGNPPMQPVGPAGPGMEPRPASPNTVEEEAHVPARAAAAAPATGLPGDAPKVAITGGVYSANPAQRMLIVNGQVFAEGAELGPGLVLQEIRAKSAVLTFRGSRYSVSY